MAPDDSSRKAGRDLANPSKWVTLGANEIVIWGECQGSGSKPYQAQIDLANIAFKCSCPSRKFPCKHGIALGLLHARQKAIFTGNEMPAWVNEWISRRSEKEAKKTEAVAEKPVDAAAQAKRHQAREQKVSDGIEDLLVWIKDIVRNGIMNLPEKSRSYWEGMAKRMIDAQAPGLAGMIKGLADTAFFKEGWQTPFLDNLLSIYLVAKGYQNRERLLPLLQQDIRSLIGFSQNQDELRDQQGINDNWLVLAKQVTEEDNLTVEKFWLYGTQTHHYALILQFVVRGQGATISLTPGMYIEAELVFFPAVNPMRALIKKQIVAKAKLPDILFESWKEIAENETQQCAHLPVRNERPYLLKQVRLVPYKNTWWLKDKEDNVMAMPEQPAALWRLLALSGGKPADMAVIGEENTYLPVGIWHNNTYKII